MKKPVYYTLLAVFLLIFIVSAFLIVDRISKNLDTENNIYNPLASIYANGTTTTGGIPKPTTPITPPGSTTSPILPPSPTDPKPTDPPAPQIRPQIKDLYDMNNHLVGWIKIEGIRVDYPVVQTPNKPGWIDYYLYRNFYGEDDKAGCIYVRETCDVFTPSDNITIYGHRMNIGTMFGDLGVYESSRLYQQYKYIQFDTLYETHTYEVFAVFRTSGTYGVGFAYHLFDDARDAAEFDEFVAKCKELALYDTGITPTYGDKLITLSTCDYRIAEENMRLVVVAKRIT